MSNFERLLGSIENYINKLNSNKSDKDHSHIGFVKTNDLSEVAFSGSYNDLDNLPIEINLDAYATIEFVNETINNAKLSGTNIDLTSYAKKSDLDSYVLKNSISTVAKSGSYNDLSNKPNIPSISGLATETYVNNKFNSINLDLYVKSSSLSTVATSGLYNDLIDKPIIPNIEGLATEDYVINAINQAQIDSGNSDIDLSIYAKLQDLSTVAKSGSYNDLSNKPTIPSIDGLATEDFVLDEISKINIINNTSSYKKFTIESSQWSLDSTNNLYTLDLNHNLNSKDIIVNSRNSSSGYTIVLSSLIIDNNNIKIYNDDNPNCDITVISIQYKPVSDTDIANKKYVDDSILNASLGNIKLATVATSGSYNDLSDKPTIPTLPTLSTVATTGSYNDLNNKPIIPSISGLASETYVNNKFDSIDLTPYAKSSTLSTIATSGSYNDLTDKPVIPSIDGLATESYIDNTMKNSIGVPLSKYPRLNEEIDDTNRFIRAFNDNKVVIIDSNVTITSISIPDNCKLYCFGNYTITTSGTISVGFQSYLIGENLTIDASFCSDEELKIVSLSKWAKVKLYQIIGYKSVDSVKGSGSNATAIYCYHSDFVQVDILRSIKYCKVGFEITSGVTGTGNTINRSYFKCAWMGEVETCFLSNESTSIMIDTEAYMEQCSIGYNVRAGFYGEHHVRFDHVDTWFVASLPEFRTRFGDIYIHNETMNTLLSKIERYYNYTTWHCSDGIILPKDKDNPFSPQIRNHPDGRITVQSGLAKFRMVSAESIQYEGKYNNNDTSGGTVITLGGDYSEFHIERQDGTSIMSMNKIGLLKTRNGIELGNATVGNANLDIKKGGVIFGRTPSINAVNNMIYVDSDTNRLKFVDNNGTSYNVIFSGSYNDLNDKPTIITMDEVKDYVDEQIQAQITTALEGEY